MEIDEFDWSKNELSLIHVIAIEAKPAFAAYPFSS